MKIRLVVTPPILDEHGLTAGMVLDARPADGPEVAPRDCRLYSGSVWVTAPDSGKEARILLHEYEIAGALAVPPPASEILDAIDSAAIASIIDTPTVTIDSLPEAPVPKEPTMKIRLLQNLPVDPDLGMKEGLVLEASPAEDPKRPKSNLDRRLDRAYCDAVWVTSPSGHRVKVLRHEFEIVADEEGGPE